jgi:hypothetical protein
MELWSSVTVPDPFPAVATVRCARTVVGSLAESLPVFVSPPPLTAAVFVEVTAVAPTFAVRLIAG